MGKPSKRPQGDADDRDAAGGKKKAKPEAQGSNTMLYVLIGGGVFAIGSLCLCGGGVGAGFYFGWFGGAKTAVAKADTDKDKPKDTSPIKDTGDTGAPKGTGPLVTGANFDKAARDGTTLAQVEQILGPGLPLVGADADRAAQYPGYKFLRDSAPPGTLAFQWSNSEEIYFITFLDGRFMGRARNPNLDNAKAKGGPPTKKKGFGKK